MINNINNNTISIWKPQGITSFDVIRKFKYYNPKSKYGHAGTLDPFAEGVLIVCREEGLKKVDYYSNLDKEYIGLIKLGIYMDTLDCMGNDIYKKTIPNLSIEHINKVLRSFKGDIMQRPPAFSALKINGVRLYELARQGIFIHKKPRKVTIHNINLLKFNNKDEIEFKVLCSKGTYIRSLARDIASKLNTCGFLKTLKRSKIGNYNISNSIHYSEIK